VFIYNVVQVKHCQIQAYYWIVLLLSIVLVLYNILCVQVFKRQQQALN